MCVAIRDSVEIRSIAFSHRSLADPSSAVGLLPPGEIDLADKCFAEPRCDATAPYRTANGGCNNLMFPVWGQSFAANTRIVQANYADGNNHDEKSTEF